MRLLSKFPPLPPSQKTVEALPFQKFVTSMAKWFLHKRAEGVRTTGYSTGESSGKVQWES